MKEIVIKAGNKTYRANTSTVGNLRKFLEFKCLYERTGELSTDVLRCLINLIQDIFPRLREKTILDMKVSELFKAAQDISDWLGAELASAEKKT